jgi:hypothetical protein
VVDKSGLLDGIHTPAPGFCKQTAALTSAGNRMPGCVSGGEQGANMTRDQDQGTGGKSQAAKDMSSWKPGSDAASAKNVGAEGDFGVPAGAGASRERDYVSENTKRSDPGNAMPRSGEEDGVRTTGAGASAGGDGSGSGGDLDPDIVGVGTGGSGVSVSGPSERSGPGDSDGSSAEMASGGPAEGRNQTGVHRVGGSKRVEGTTFSRSLGDASTTGDGQGAASVTNPAARGDDSFAAEISAGEAMGEDNPMDRSSDNSDG